MACVEVVASEGVCGLTGARVESPDSGIRGERECGTETVDMSGASSTATYSSAGVGRGHCRG